MNDFYQNRLNNVLGVPIVICDFNGGTVKDFFILAIKLGHKFTIIRIFNCKNANGNHCFLLSFLSGRVLLS